MRTPLFLSTLVAVTLAGGAALAEKPQHHTEHQRAHGNMVDKSYHAEARAAHASPQGSTRVAPPARQLTTASSRVSCSDVASDCPARSAAARGAGVEASAGATGRASRQPAFLDRVAGSDRTNFNEAGEAQGMSSRAVKRAWSHGGAAGPAAGATVPLAHQEQRARGDAQASGVRMACNEGDQCSISSKAVKKEWAYQSIRAGTWKGPEAPPPSGAEKSLAEMRGAPAAHPAAQTAHAPARQHDHNQDR